MAPSTLCCSASSAGVDPAKGLRPASSSSSKKPLPFQLTACAATAPVPVCCTAVAVTGVASASTGEVWSGCGGDAAAMKLALPSWLSASYMLTTLRALLLSPLLYDSESETESDSVSASASEPDSDSESPPVATLLSVLSVSPVDVGATSLVTGSNITAALHAASLDRPIHVDSLLASRAEMLASPLAVGSSRTVSIPHTVTASPAPSASSSA
mmetsp:Transcript_10883/g.32605  ORF Transcript_10883/g.32605 Transcript_10883/m.32605 type:complete len:213 (+) Transcript_10883:579-1217(+)